MRIKYTLKVLRRRAQSAFSKCELLLEYIGYMCTREYIAVYIFLNSHDRLIISFLQIRKLGLRESKEENVSRKDKLTSHVMLIH